MIEWKFWVVPSFAGGVLLGNDYLDEMDGSFSYRRGTFEADGISPQPLYLGRKHRHFLTTRQDYTIPALRTLELRATLGAGRPPPAWWKPGRTVEVVGNAEMGEELGLVVANSWDYLDPVAGLTVRVCNPYPHDITLPGDYPLAHLEEPDVQSGATPLLLGLATQASGEAAAEDQQTDSEPFSPTMTVRHSLQWPSPLGQEDGPGRRNGSDAPGGRFPRRHTL